MCGISECISCTRLIDNEGFNSLEYFCIMDRDTDVLYMANFLDRRDVATCVKIGTVQIKEIQDLVWWVNDFQTHDHLLIAAEFL